jgi:hypothetical protein
MSILDARIPIEDFDAHQDKIALMLKSLTVKKKDGGFGKNSRRYTEPYVIGLSIAENGLGNRQINFVEQYFPNTRIHQKKEFLANGLRIFGPENPGEFLVFDILVMESDDKERKNGERLRQIMNSVEVTNGILPKLAGINPTIAVATEALTLLSSLISSQMKANRDDDLLRAHGTLMRGVMGTDSRPYNVGDLIVESNDAAELEVSIFAIKRSDRHQKQTESVST